MEKTGIKPAYRIQTSRFILRCFQPTDAPLLQQAIKESVDHLLPWMPWAASEPEKLQIKIERLRSYRSNFDSDKEYIFGIFNPEETEILGACGLHKRVGPNALEIGYWIHKSHIKKGYATEIAEALTKVAFDVQGVTRMEIHCDSKNIASATIPRKLRYKLDATLRRRSINYKGEISDEMIWSLFRDEYIESPLYHKKLKVYDVMGRKLKLI